MSAYRRFFDNPESHLFPTDYSPVRAAQKERTQQLTSPQTPSTNQRKVFRMLRTLFDPMAVAPSVDDVGADDTDDTQ